MEKRLLLSTTSQTNSKFIKSRGSRAVQRGGDVVQGNRLGPGGGCQDGVSWLVLLEDKWFLKQKKAECGVVEHLAKQPQRRTMRYNADRYQTHLFRNITKRYFLVNFFHRQT